MAKRVIKKKTAKETKQDAAARRTKKKKSTAVKKAPTKKTAIKSSTAVKKTAIKTKRKVKSGKNPTKKTTLAQAVKKPVSKKKKKEEDKYIRVSENANIKRFVELGEKVQSGEVKWSHYAIDGNVAYHHYLVLKK